MATGRIDYLEPDKFKKEFKSETVEVTPEDMQHVGSQIAQMYDAIHKYQFDTSCEDQDCRWCNFATEHYKTQPQEMKPGHVFDVQLVSEKNLDGHMTPILTRGNSINLCDGDAILLSDRGFCFLTCF